MAYGNISCCKSPFWIIIPTNTVKGVQLLGTYMQEVVHPENRNASWAWSLCGRQCGVSFWQRLWCILLSKQFMKPFHKDKIVLDTYTCIFCHSGGLFGGIEMMPFYYSSVILISIITNVMSISSSVQLLFRIGYYKHWCLLCVSTRNYCASRCILQGSSEVLVA